MASKTIRRQTMEWVTLKHFHQNHTVTFSPSIFIAESADSFSSSLCVECRTTQQKKKKPNEIATMSSQ